MSIKLMAQVWERQVDREPLLVLLALADHGDDDGLGIFPSAGLIAWKTGYSRRSVLRIMATLRELGALVVMRPGGGRGRPTVYRMVLSALPAKRGFVVGREFTTRSRGTSPSVRLAPPTRVELSLPGLHCAATDARSTLAVRCGGPQPSRRAACERVECGDSPG